MSARDSVTSILDRLCCPVSRAPLVRCGDWLYAVDPDGRRKYPVTNGVPCLLAESAVVAETSEFEQVMAAQKE